MLGKNVGTKLMIPIHQHILIGPLTRRTVIPDAPFTNVVSGRGRPAGGTEHKLLNVLVHTVLQLEITVGTNYDSPIIFPIISRS